MARTRIGFVDDSAVGQDLVGNKAAEITRGGGIEKDEQGRGQKTGISQAGASQGLATELPTVNEHTKIKNRVLHDFRPSQNMTGNTAAAGVVCPRSR